MLALSRVHCAGQSIPLRGESDRHVHLNTLPVRQGLLHPQGLHPLARGQVDHLDATVPAGAGGVTIVGAEDQRLGHSVQLDCDGTSLLNIPDPYLSIPPSGNNPPTVSAPSDEVHGSGMPLKHLPEPRPGSIPQQDLECFANGRLVPRGRHRRDPPPVRARRRYAGGVAKTQLGFLGIGLREVPQHCGAAPTAQQMRPVGRKGDGRDRIGLSWEAAHVA